MDYLVRARLFCLSGVIALVTSMVWPVSLAVAALWAVAMICEATVARRAPWAVLAATLAFFAAAVPAGIPAGCAAAAAAILVSDVATYTRIKRAEAQTLPQEPS